MPIRFYYHWDSWTRSTPTRHTKRTLEDLQWNVFCVSHGLCYNSICLCFPPASLCSFHLSPKGGGDLGTLIMFSLSQFLRKPRRITPQQARWDHSSWTQKLNINTVLRIKRDKWLDIFSAFLPEKTEMLWLWLLTLAFGFQLDWSQQSVSLFNL